MPKVHVPEVRVTHMRIHAAAPSNYFCQSRDSRVETPRPWGLGVLSMITQSIFSLASRQTSSMGSQVVIRGDELKMC